MEDGAKYTIEVILRKGFQFGVYMEVYVKLSLPGSKTPISFMRIRRPADYENCTREDIKQRLEFATVEVEGPGWHNARSRFAFHALQVGM